MLMADDKEILKEVWDGKLPICFKLSTDELTITDPEDIYVSKKTIKYIEIIMHCKKTFLFILANGS